MTIDTLTYFKNIKGSVQKNLKWCFGGGEIIKSKIKDSCSYQTYLENATFSSDIFSKEVSQIVHCKEQKSFPGTYQTKVGQWRYGRAGVPIWKAAYTKSEILQIK